MTKIITYGDKNMLMNNAQKIAEIIKTNHFETVVDFSINNNIQCLSRTRYQKTPPGKLMSVQFWGWGFSKIHLQVLTLWG